jgi:hypothetical protein
MAPILVDTFDFRKQCADIGAIAQR